MFAQPIDGFAERGVLGVLDEIQHVALGLATEAVVILVVGGNMKGGGVLVMKWAQPRPVASRLAQVDGLPDQVDNIDLGLELLDVHAPRYRIW